MLLRFYLKSPHPTLYYSTSNHIFIRNFAWTVIDSAGLFRKMTRRTSRHPLSYRVVKGTNLTNLTRKYWKCIRNSSEMILPINLCPGYGSSKLVIRDRRLGTKNPQQSTVNLVLMERTKVREQVVNLNKIKVLNCLHWVRIYQVNRYQER